MKKKLTSRVSLKDVAARASVSKSTVSLVFNGREGGIPLSDASIRRVREAARDLGYRPNVFARGLVRGNAELHALAVLTPLESVPYGSVMVEALSGLVATAGESGFSCNLIARHLHASERLTDPPVFQERLVQGVVALGWEHVNQESLRVFEEQLLPIVAVHMEPDDPSIPCVTSDDLGNAYKLTEHLCQLGHKRFAFMGGPLAGDVANLRISGFKQCLDERGLEVPASHILRGDYSVVDWSCVDQLFRQDEKPTAVVAVSDLVAAKLVAWLKERGLSVPGDVSVVGFDDDALAGFLDPPLTTIRATATRQGQYAAKIVLDLIAGKPVEKPRIALPGDLLVRQSTGKPKVSAV